jgi:hypothetical protein
MLEKDLDKKIDKAPEIKVRECLKIIASLWFVKDGEANFNKDLDSSIYDAVTGELQRFGFCPKENK